MLVFGFAAFMASVSLQAAPPAQPQVAVPSGPFHPYDKIELTVTGLPEVTTPFNPAVIALDATIKTPGGETVRLPGFAELRCSEVKINDDLRYQPSGGLDWHIRYAGAAAGDYQGTVTVTTPDGTARSEPFHFTIAKAESPVKGMIHVAKNNPRAFAYDDGSSFIAMGEDLCWSKPKRDLLWGWIDKLGQNGANWIRIWTSMGPCFGIEGTKPYNYNEDGARAVDHALEKCEANNIAAYLCFDHVRGFGAPPVPPHLWNYFTDYPYDIRNGGPAANLQEMLEKRAAQIQYEARLRYAIARWGYSRAVFGWELWNEMDAVQDDGKLHPGMVKWVDIMCQYLHANDPYHHLASTSLGSDGVWRDLWSLPSVDFVNYHDYGGRDHYKGVSQVDVYAPVMAKLSGFWKPVLFSEVGLVNNDWGLNEHQDYAKFGATVPQDSNNYAFHEALWLPFFTGAAGGGMHWWWENFDYFKVYPLYRPLADFVSDVPLAQSPMPVMKATASAPYLKPFARGNVWGAVAWVWNSHNPWQTLVIDKKTPETVSGASVTLPVKGRFTVHCYDTRSGKELSQSTIVANGNGLVVPLPDFQIDIAVKAVRIP